MTGLIREYVLERRLARLAVTVRAEGLTYLGESKLESLLEACRSVRRGGVRGEFIEASCALGGSTVVIANAGPLRKGIR